jgi:hypothetical protein
MSFSQIQMSLFPETYLAEGLTFTQGSTANREQSLINSMGVRKLTTTRTEKHMGLFLKY